MIHHQLPPEFLLAEHRERVQRSITVYERLGTAAVAASPRRLWRPARRRQPVGLVVPLASRGERISAAAHCEGCAA